MMSSPHCITFCSGQAPHEISFCPKSWTDGDPSPLDPERNAILFPTSDDNKWYVSLDAYSLTLKLPLQGEDIYAQLAKQIYELTHGIVCIRMMDKGYADDISMNANKYEAVYPTNVLNGSISTIRDTVLYEEAFLVPISTYKDYVQGPLANKYTYLHIHSDAIKHPIYYPVPPLSTEYDTKTIVINIYHKLPPPNGGSDVSNRIYIPLFDAQSGHPSHLVYKSFTKLKFCNEAHLQENSLGANYCSSTTTTDDMSAGGRYLLGTVDTLSSYDNNYQQYPLKVNFKNAAINSNEQLQRDDLQLGIDKTWEITVSRATYNLSESNLIMIPHPTVAKERTYTICTPGKY